METIVTIGIFVLASVSDIRSKDIALCIPLIGIVIGVTFMIFNGAKADNINGIIIGVGIMLVSLLVKDFGMGDGFMALALGILQGAVICMETLIIAALLTLVVGGIIMLVKKEKEKLYLPFVPFMLVGFITTNIIGGIG